MKNFSKFIGNMAKIVTKIVEVFQWVGAGMMLAATICALVNPDWIGYFIGFDACESCGAKLSVYGFEIQAAVTNGQVDMTALFLFGIGATLILGLMAMISKICICSSKNPREPHRSSRTMCVCSVRSASFLSLSLLLALL